MVPSQLSPEQQESARIAVLQDSEAFELLLKRAKLTVEKGLDGLTLDKGTEEFARTALIWAAQREVLENLPRLVQSAWEETKRG